MREEHSLKGKTITGLQIAEDKLALKFLTDQGEIIALCDADCCSSTWIEHVELPALGFPATVIECIDLDLGDRDEWTDGDLTQFYGLQVKTDKGDIVIDYRNFSNGYYGGSLAFPHDNYYYGGVFDQCVTKGNFVDITQDI